MSSGESVKLSEKQRRKVACDGQLEVPNDISWRKADQIIRSEVAVLTLFHRRWRALLLFTDAGRLALSNTDTSHGD